MSASASNRASSSRQSSTNQDIVTMRSGQTDHSLSATDTSALKSNSKAIPRKKLAAAPISTFIERLTERADAIVDSMASEETIANAVTQEAEEIKRTSAEQITRFKNGVQQAVGKSVNL